MGINSYANWKIPENCKGVLIATVRTKLLGFINSKRVMEVMLFPLKFFPTADFLAVFHPATCYKTLASDMR